MLAYACSSIIMQSIPVVMPAYMCRCYFCLHVGYAVVGYAVCELAYSHITRNTCHACA